MNDDRRAIGVIYRVRLALLERDSGVQDFDGQVTALRYVQIGHIAGVLAFRRHHPMLLSAGIEVPARGGEGRLTFADGVHMKRMLAWGQPFERCIDQYSLRRLCKVDRTDLLAFSIFHDHRCCLRGGRNGRTKKRDCGHKAKTGILWDCHRHPPGINDCEHTVTKSLPRRLDERAQSRCCEFERSGKSAWYPQSLITASSTSPIGPAPMTSTKK